MKDFQGPSKPARGWTIRLSHHPAAFSLPGRRPSRGSLSARIKRHDPAFEAPLAADLLELIVVNANSDQLGHAVAGNEMSQIAGAGSAVAFELETHVVHNMALLSTL